VKYNSPQKECVALLVRADGESCNSTDECSNPDSRCDTIVNGGDNTCKSIVGLDCNSYSTCGANSIKWDCSCSARKCYVLNQITQAPTQAPGYVPPVPVYPCAAQKLAWDAVYPNSGVGAVDSMITWQAYANAINSLPNSTLPALFNYLCCLSCGTSRAFQTPINDPYQLDCGAKVFRKLTSIDRCNVKKSEYALLNCFQFSAAWTPAFSLGLIAVLISLL